MCQTIDTAALHHEMKEHFEECNPDRCIGDHYVEQFEPWNAPSRELWTDELLDQIVRARVERRGLRRRLDNPTR